MGWQERDYAQPEPPRWLRSGGSSRPSGSSYNIVTVLIVVNAVIYLAATSNPALFRWGAMFTPLVLKGQIWRLVTSDYLHWNLTHILFNMLGLYFLGRPLVQLWGVRKFFAVYTVAGVLGSSFYMVLGMMGALSLDGIAAGASGCVLGLLGACAVLFPHAEVYIYFLFPIKIRTAAIIFAGLYIWNVYTRGANAGGDACHLAGLAFGAWYAWRGDVWWMRSGLRASLTGARRSPGDRFGRVKRASPNKGAWERKMKKRATEGEDIDRILKKVYDGGIHTLTPGERQILAEATERQRQEELRAGRGG